MADLICPFSFIAFSMCLASLVKIVSSNPPTSPACTMFTYKSSNTFGCRRRASEKVDPPSTWPFTSPTVSRRTLFSDCVERISRHCTSGRPALIMVPNCLVKTTRSLSVRPEPKLRLNPPLPDFSSRLVTTTLCLRSWSTASSLLLAFSSPFFTAPDLVRPTYANVAIRHAHPSIRPAIGQVCRQNYLPGESTGDPKTCQTNAQSARNSPTTQNCCGRNNQELEDAAWR